MRLMFLDLVGDDRLTRHVGTLARACAAAGDEVVYFGAEPLPAAPLASAPLGSAPLASAPLAGAAHDVVQLAAFAPQAGIVAPALPPADTNSDEEAAADGGSAEDIARAAASARALFALRGERIQSLTARLRPNLIIATVGPSAVAGDDGAAAVMPLLADIGAATRARWGALMAEADDAVLVLDGQRLPVETQALRAKAEGLFPPRQPFAQGAAHLVAPSPGALIDDGPLQISGTLIGAGVQRIWVTINDGPDHPLEFGPAFPGPGRPFAGEVEVAGEACRLALRLLGETAWGETADLGTTVVWQPRHAPPAPRILPVAVEAACIATPSGARLRGRLTQAEPSTAVANLCLEAWQAGRVTLLPCDSDGHFDTPWHGSSDTDIHLWARFDDGHQDAYLLHLPATERPACAIRDWGADAWFEAGELTVALTGADAPANDDLIVNGRPVRWVSPQLARLAAQPDLVVVERLDGGDAVRKLLPRAPMLSDAFRRARKAGRMLKLPLGSGRQTVHQTVHPLRLQPTVSGWSLTVRQGMAVEDLRLAELPGSALAGAEVAETAWSAVEDRALARELREHAARQRPPTRPLGEDLPRPQLLPIVESPRREPPQSIDRVVLIRPGAFPTDDLYVLRPLPPLLTGHGLELVVLTASDAGEGADASALPPLTAETVVVISRQAPAAWRAAVVASPAFVIYLIDDDLAAAADTPGLSHDFRHRMMELLASDMAPLLRRCDRLLVTSPGLASRYASGKTELMAPPYVRRPSSLAHHGDDGPLRITYQGTESHSEDIEFLLPMLGRILERHAHAHLTLFGRRALPPPLRGHPRVELMKPLSWSEYVAFVAANPAHIALAPMLDTPFNRGKSVLKFLDAASLGAAGIFSATMPFDTLVQDGVDGLLVPNDPARWEDTLDTLLGDPPRIASLARSGQERAERIGGLEAAIAVWGRLLGLAPAGQIGAGHGGDEP